VVRVAPAAWAACTKKHIQLAHYLNPQGVTVTAWRPFCLPPKRWNPCQHHAYQYRRYRRCRAFAQAHCRSLRRPTPHPKGVDSEDPRSGGHRCGHHFNEDLSSRTLVTRTRLEQGFPFRARFSLFSGGLRDRSLRGIRGFLRFPAVGIGEAPPNKEAVRPKANAAFDK
jgi:hypothetical protein